MLIRLRPLLGFISILMSILGASLARAHVQTEMRLFSDSFISPTFEATQKTNYQFVGAQLKTDSFSDETIQMDLSGGVAMGAPLLNYLNISEFYVQMETADDAALYLGRKKMNWNDLDSRWNMGVWQPLFKWNPLAPEEQGLTGLFWQVDKPFYTMMLFASPIFIPDQGPSFEIENGSFVKGNPWFRRPPENIRIWSEATAIDYNLQKPNEAQVVLQKSYGMKASVGDPEGLRGQVSYAYKPANQLAIGYEGKLNIADLKGAVNLQPQVFYHSLAGADVTYKAGKFLMGVSATLDRPNQEEIFAAQWTHPVFEDAVLVSPFVEWNNSVFGISLQHIDIQGGKVSEQGELADSSRAPLMSRYPFYQAQQVAVKTNWSFSKNRHLLAKLSFTHSEKNEFDLVRLSSKLRLSRLWSILAEMQIVKAGDLSLQNQNEISQFQNNDRLMVGAAYVF